MRFKPGQIKAVQIKDLKARFTEIVLTFLDVFVLHIALFGVCLFGVALSLGLRQLLYSETRQTVMFCTAIAICGIKRTVMSLWLVGVGCLVVSALAWKGEDFFRLLMSFLLLLYTKPGIILTVVVVTLFGCTKKIASPLASRDPSIIDVEFSILD